MCSVHATCGRMTLYNNQHLLRELPILGSKFKTFLGNRGIKCYCSSDWSHILLFSFICTNKHFLFVSVKEPERLWPVRHACCYFYLLFFCSQPQGHLTASVVPPDPHPPPSPYQCRHAVCIFYLVLRALDTVEDDMSIPLDKKVPMLNDFHTFLYQDDWCFTESREKDRQVLEDFPTVSGSTSVSWGYVS